MDAIHNPAHAQHAAGAVCHQFQPDGHCHHPVYHHRPDSDPATHGETSPSDAGYELSSAPPQGNPDPLRQRPLPNFPGNDEGISRCWGQPRGLYRALDRADANSYRLVPGAGPSPFQRARQTGGVVREDLSLCAFRDDLLCCPAGLGLSVAGLGRRGPPDATHTNNGVCFHLGPAEDDDEPVGGPTATGQSDHDALDDAVDDCLFLSVLSQWPGLVLDRFQCNRRRNTILYYRVATPVPSVPQTGAGCGAGPARIGRATPGDGGSWKYAS